MGRELVFGKKWFTSNLLTVCEVTYRVGVRVRVRVRVRVSVRVQG